MHIAIYVLQFLLLFLQFDFAHSKTRPNGIKIERGNGKRVNQRPKQCKDVDSQHSKSQQKNFDLAWERWKNNNRFNTFPSRRKSKWINLVKQHTESASVCGCVDWCVPFWGFCFRKRTTSWARYCDCVVVKNVKWSNSKSILRCCCMRLTKTSHWIHRLVVNTNYQLVKNCMHWTTERREIEQNNNEDAMDGKEKR